MLKRILSSAQWNSMPLFQYLSLSLSPSLSLSFCISLSFFLCLFLVLCWFNSLVRFPRFFLKLLQQEGLKNKERKEPTGHFLTYYGIIFTFLPSIFLFSSFFVYFLSYSLLLSLLPVAFLSFGFFLFKYLLPSTFLSYLFFPYAHHTLNQIYISWILLEKALEVAIAHTDAHKYLLKNCAILRLSDRYESYEYYTRVFKNQVEKKKIREMIFKKQRKQKQKKKNKKQGLFLSLLVSYQ